MPGWLVTTTVRKPALAQPAQKIRGALHKPHLLRPARRVEEPVRLVVDHLVQSPVPIDEDGGETTERWSVGVPECWGQRVLGPSPLHAVSLPVFSSLHYSNTPFLSTASSSASPSGFPIS